MSYQEKSKETNKSSLASTWIYGQDKVKREFKREAFEKSLKKTK